MMKFGKIGFAICAMFVVLLFMVPFFVTGVLFQLAFGAFMVGREGAENLHDWLSDATKGI